MSKQWTAVEYGKPDSVQLRDDDGVFGEVDREKAPLILAAMEVMEVLREFVQDIDAVGERHTSEEWPDLLVTYHKARAAIAKAEGTP